MAKFYMAEAYTLAILRAEYILRTAFGTTTKYKLFLKYFLKFS